MSTLEPPSSAAGTIHDRRSTRRRRDDGVILLAVLWLALFLAVAMGSMATLAQKARFRSETEERRAQMEALADGALTLVAMRLANGDAETIEATRSGDPVHFTLFAAAVRAQIVPEGDKVDLNAADHAALTELFSDVGSDAATASAQAAAVLDFRDNNDLRRASGAEALRYRAAGLSHGPRNGRFADVGELALVYGVDALTAEKAARRATVFGGRATARRASLARRLSRRATVDPTAPTRVMSSGEPSEASGVFYTIDILAVGADGARGLVSAIIAIRPGATPPFAVHDWRRRRR